MVPGAVDESLLAAFGLVYDQGEVVLLHFEDSARVPVEERDAWFK